MQHDCDCRPKHVPGRGINAQGEVLMACCRCCEKAGACCNGGSCTQETCADCEDAGGQFQGVDTECVSGDCPCDPPADPALCEKCVDGTQEVYCPESAPNCCDGVCQAEPCGTPCSVDADCTYNAASCADLGGCEVDGVTVRLFPDTTQGLLDALDYINALDPGSCGACTVDPGTGKCCDDICYPDSGDLPGFYTLPLVCP